MRQATFGLISGLALIVLAQSYSHFDASGRSVLGGLPEGSAYSTEWRITGPSGGDVRALVVDPNDPDRFYFGTLDGQIYISTDAGLIWRLLINFNRPGLFVDNIIVDSRNSRVLYVAAHRHKDPGGFFKSIDGGLNWRESPDLRGEALHSLIQSESNPDMLLAGTITGIFRSLDSGESWTRLPATGITDVASLAIDPRDANVIYAGTWWLPYKTSDGGRTWKIIKRGFIDDSEVFAISIDPRDRNHIIASACSGIYDSRDAGENWKRVQGIPSQSRRTRAILQHPSLPGLVFAGTTEGFWRSTNGGENNSWTVTTSRELDVNSIAVHPGNPNTVYIATNNNGVMVSRDGGKNFVPTKVSTRFVNSILPDREIANRIYATTINTTLGGGFFFVSSDGGESWQPSMRNLPARLIGYTILQDVRDGNMIYLGTNLGLYRSLDRGASWHPILPQKSRESLPTRQPSASSGVHRDAAQIRTPSPTENAIVESPDIIRRAQEALQRAGYEMGNPDGRLGPRTVTAIKRFQKDRYLPQTGQLNQVTIDALGVSNNASGELTPHVTVLSDQINDLVSFSDRAGRMGILAATNRGLYRTFDLTQGWDRIAYAGELDARTTCISISQRDPSLVFVGTATSGVLMSRDAGDTWKQVSGVPTTAPVNIIVQDPQRPDFIYAGTKQAFYSSHDGAETWSRRGGNLPFGDFTSILISPRNTDEIFAGNAYLNGEVGGGVYRSTDAGSTWIRIDAGEQRLPSMGIWALALDEKDGTLFVGSHSAGVYVVSRGGKGSLDPLR
jgi:photosystem II stability/assembly factor-like uncharacterized protein